MSSNQIKLYLLTGFLGAGKTTLLQKLIRHLQDKKIGIIMNEFANIGIDGMLIKKDNLDILEINNGSVFCSCLKGTFIEGLITYSELPIEYLFVETSGMADPSSIQDVLENVVGKVRGKSYDYRGSISIADAPHFLDHVDLWIAIEKQILASDLILVNKMDMIDEGTFAEVKERILGINPRVELYPTTYCDMDFAFLERDIRTSHQDGPTESCNTPANRPHAFTLIADGCFQEAVLRDFLKALAGDAFRIKGFFRLQSGWQQVDVVGGQIVLKPTAVPCETSQLVIISDKGLPMLQAIFANWDQRFTEKMILK